jgi:hypothetical protein
VKKFFRAQSTLEFIMILILVIAGIFVMGPYVIRSVNAYMRSWEISASQLRHSPQQQVPVAQVNLCGNGACDFGETNAQCPVECFCGNGSCDYDESLSSCRCDCQRPCSSFSGTECCGPLAEGRCYRFTDTNGNLLGCFDKTTIVFGGNPYPISPNCMFGGIGGNFNGLNNCGDCNCETGLGETTSNCPADCQ